MLKLIVSIVTSLFCLSAVAGDVIKRSEWQSFFVDDSVKGVFVLCDLSGNLCQTNDKVRVSTRFIPASTFKIPNSLIALETGVVKDELQVFKWDGVARPLKQWDKDFTLRGAMQNSVVPLYQGIARAVGEERMRHYVERVSYGNADINGGIDRFWLDGALRISAIEQIDFLKQLYLDKLPFTKRNQLIVKDALITEASNDYLLRAKTGYSLGVPGYGDRTKPGVAWWVGWIEKGTAVYFFAANFDIEKDSQLASRKTIPAKILRTQGILP